MKVEAFPIILYGSEYWSGLTEWIMQKLIPRYIDAEDIRIFRIVDSPSDVVKFIKQGLKHHWWPLNAEVRKITEHGAGKRKGPLSGSKVAESGEGTRYGKRPRRPQKTHAKPSRKPQQ